MGMWVFLNSFQKMDTIKITCTILKNRSYSPRFMVPTYYVRQSLVSYDFCSLINLQIIDSRYVPT